MRFWLAVWVMLHHLAGKNMMLEGWVRSLPEAGQRLVLGGYLSVQTFFILSGFVLARTYARADWEPADLARYATARLARIYPVYVLSLLLVSPFIVKTMLNAGRTAAEKLQLLFAYGFVLQGWTTDLNVGWNTPAWSLSCEFFFYLLFPFVFPLLRDAGWRKLTLVFAVAIVAPVTMAHAGVPWHWKPLHHFADFAVGIATARIFQMTKQRMMGRGAWLYLPAIALGIVLIVNPGILRGTYGDLNTVLRPLDAAALIGLAFSGGLIARVMAAPICDYLGKVSYSMYILHVPVLWWYSDWARHGSWHMPMWLAASLYFAIVTGVSAAAFRYVEVPANKWIRTRVDANLAREPEPILTAAAA